MRLDSLLWVDTLNVGFVPVQAKYRDSSASLGMTSDECAQVYCEAFRVWEG